MEVGIFQGVRSIHPPAVSTFAGNRSWCPHESWPFLTPRAPDTSEDVCRTPGCCFLDPDCIPEASFSARLPPQERLAPFQDLACPTGSTISRLSPEELPSHINVPVPSARSRRPTPPRPSCSKHSFILFYFVLTFYLFLRQGETEHEQGRVRERETQNLKQAPGSELSAQSPTQGSNSRTARS